MSGGTNAASRPALHCLACGGTNLAMALDLGAQPPANFLLERPEDAYPIYPLGLTWCRDCGHGQLPFLVAPEELFRHYLYASGTSGTLGRFFDWFRDETARVFPKGARLLEIACNDGSLLGRLAAAGFATLGVDPAENLVAEARRDGLDVLAEFWPCPEALGDRAFDLIIGMNVLAHNPAPFEFLCGVREALSRDGICVIQTSQANMLVNGEFDTIYHEHYSFFTPRSMAALTRRAGLEIRAVKLVDVHGTSFAFLLAKPGGGRDIEGYLSSPPFAVAAGDAHGSIVSRVTGSDTQYQTFAETARARMETVRRIIARHRAAGRRICAVGAAAKALVFLHAAGLRPDYVYDEAPLKIGRFIPAMGVPILALDRIAGLDEPALIVISAWNYRNELARKVRDRRPGRNDTFLVYFPEVEEFE